MARITVEDCIDKFPSRFELVLVASQRARHLNSGETPTIEKDNDKNTVIALREIAESSLTVENIKENLIQEYQTITISDEEEEITDEQGFYQEYDTWIEKIRELSSYDALLIEQIFHIDDDQSTKVSEDKLKYNSSSIQLDSLDDKDFD